MTLDLAALFSKVQAPISTSETLPPACYHDKDLARVERDTIFRSSWIGLGRHDQWKAAGDYSALTIAGIPLIILRDKQGKLRCLFQFLPPPGLRTPAGLGQGADH